MPSPATELDKKLNEIYTTQASLYQNIEIAVSAWKKFLATQKISKRNQEQLQNVIDAFQAILKNKVFEKNPYQSNKTAAEARQQALMDLARITRSPQSFIASFEAMKVFVLEQVRMQNALNNIPGLEEYTKQNCKGLSTQALVIMPPQRGPRYEMLFKEVVKELDKEKVPTDLQQMLKSLATNMSALLVSQNNTQKHQENFSKLVGSLTEVLEKWKKTHLIRSHKAINVALDNLKAIEKPTTENFQERLDALGKIYAQIKPLVDNKSLDDDIKKKLIVVLKNNEYFKDIQLEGLKAAETAAKEKAAQPKQTAAEPINRFAKPDPLKAPPIINRQTPIQTPEKPARPTKSSVSNSASAMFTPSNDKNEYTLMFRGLTALLEQMKKHYDLHTFTGDMKVIQDALSYIALNPNMKPEQKWDKLREVTRLVVDKREKSAIPIDPMTKLIQLIILTGNTQISKDNLRKSLEKFIDLNKDKYEPPRSTRG